MLVWQAHEVKLRSLAFSPDGTRVATTAGDSKFAWLWDAPTGKLAVTLEGAFHAPVRSVAFFPDGRHLAGHLTFGGIRVWDIDSEEVVAALDTGGYYPDALAVSPDGSRLVACVPGSLAEWENPTEPTGDKPRSPTRTHPAVLRGTPRIGYSPAGTYLCIAEWLMRLIDPVTFKEVRALPDLGGSTRLGASATDFAFTRDEGKLVVALGHRATVWSPPQSDNRPVAIAGHGKTVRAVGFLPGGQVLTAGMDGTARVWDATTGTELRSFDWGIGKVRVAAVSPDGTLCAAGSDDGRIVVWDVDG